MEMPVIVVCIIKLHLLEYTIFFLLTPLHNCHCGFMDMLDNFSLSVELQIFKFIIYVYRVTFNIALIVLWHSYIYSYDLRLNCVY